MNLTLITHGAVALVTAGLLWQFMDARHDAVVGEMRVNESNERLAAASRIRAEERAVAKNYQEALNAARARLSQRDRDITLLHAAADGLRGQLSEAARRIAAAPPAAVAEYALALQGVFGDCSRRYTEVVKHADGHADDARTLIDAWPRQEGMTTKPPLQRGRP